VSPSDPAAQWTGAMRGPAFFAYADNYLIDVKFGIIVDVEASRAIRQADSPRQASLMRQSDIGSRQASRRWLARRCEKPRCCCTKVLA
jgi:predicted NAD-dependent protein-ADP-ribosyltransferase YbiA (DUF1768 family)